MESGLHIAVAPERLFELFGFPVTNTLLSSAATSGVLVLLAAVFYFKLKEVPGRFQNFLEAAVEAVLDAMESIFEDKVLARKFFPLVMTIFLFVWLANWMEFLPVFGSVVFQTEKGTAPLLRSVNTDLNVTIALAIISVAVVEAAGIAVFGLKYGKKFFNFAGPMGFFVGLIELLSELARLISFSFRLFGNIFAGEVLILVFAYFVPLILPVPFMAFEVFIGFLQAAIFAGLTVVFIKIAVSAPH